MKTTKRPYAIHRSCAAFFVCAIALICSGCFSPWKGAGDEGIFTINLNGEGSRAAVAWPGDDPASVSRLNFTVTFLSGSSITIPVRTGMSYSGYNFAGWNTKADGTGTAYAPNSTYTPGENITLYAWYNAPKVGDTGPGGGIIFYHVPAGFLVDGEIQYYMEASPFNLQVPYVTLGFKWCNTIGGVNVSGTSTAIGAGRRNTDIIYSTTYPAANICGDYSRNDFGDWFLPGKDELAELYKHKDLFTDWGDSDYSYTRYWSSSCIDASGAWSLVISTGAQGKLSQDSSQLVRAIRAF